MQIVEEKIKGKRASHSTAPWWQFERGRPELYKALSHMDRVIALSRVGEKMGLAFLPSHVVLAETLVVFTLPTSAAFCTLQSRVHEVWARFFASSMKDDLRYTPTDCFETFPFPEGFETHPRLEPAGQAYYDFRATLMVRNNEGLTKIYNRFHDPNERSPDILKVRELHAAMDRAVLDSYSWTDLKPTCEFLLAYEEEEDEEEGGGRQRKKPWRYRWPDDFRDEVLARLLDLNKQRAEEEKVPGKSVTKQKKPRRSRGRAKEEGPTMF
jgi:hypothetical protein